LFSLHVQKQKSLEQQSFEIIKLGDSEAWGIYISGFNSFIGRL